MTDFYQSPEFLKSVAAGVAVFIILVFALKYPFKKKSPKWTVSQYYMYLNACIKSSNNMEQLDQWRPEVDKFFDKHYKGDSSNEVLKRYYARLLKSISEMENQFNAQKVAI